MERKSFYAADFEQQDKVILREMQCDQLFTTVRKHLTMPYHLTSIAYLSVSLNSLYETVQYPF